MNQDNTHNLILAGFGGIYLMLKVTTNREWLGKNILKWNFIEKKIKKEFLKTETKFAEHVVSKESNFPRAHFVIPESGLAYDKCVDIINHYTQIVIDTVGSKSLSGTIYGQNFLNTFPDCPPVPDIDSNNHYEVMKIVEVLCTEIYRRAHLWNSLHDEEFPIGSYIERQVISMVAESMGSNPSKSNDIMGIVTSGGTQSIMTAARAYMNYGMARGLNRDSCVIIAPRTIHASLMKARDAYGFNLILVNTDKNGNVIKKELNKAIDDHRNSIVALFCSAPSYPYGTIDDIKMFGLLARDLRAGLHVDLCLGGFVINFARDFKPLSVNGVTSISVDTHKNGLTSKGSSVLIGKNMYGENLMYYSCYTVEGWLGGLYGTPNDEGSKSCVPAFCALITMLFLGIDYYRATANKIIETGHAIGNFLLVQQHVKVIGYIDMPNTKPYTFHPEKKYINKDNNETQLESVIAFSLDPLHYKTGAIYALADSMKEKGIVLNSLTNEIVHFCITQRSAFENDFLKKFKTAFSESLDVISKANGDKNHSFTDGSSRLYSSVDLALAPSKRKMSMASFVQNWFFGIFSVRDAIRRHFMAQMNPNYNRFN